MKVMVVNSRSVASSPFSYPEGSNAFSSNVLPPVDIAENIPQPRVLLISSKLKSPSVVQAATREDVVLLPMNYETGSLNTIVEKVRIVLNGRSMKSLMILGVGTSNDLLLCSGLDEGPHLLNLKTVTFYSNELFIPFCNFFSRDFVCVYNLPNYIYIYIYICVCIRMCVCICMYVCVLHEFKFGKLQITSYTLHTLYFLGTNW